MAVDRDRERSLPEAGVDRPLRTEFESFTRRAIHRDAEIAAADPGEEVDDLGGDELGRDHEVTFVLTVLVVHEHDHAAGAEVFENVGDGCK